MIKLTQKNEKGITLITLAISIIIMIIIMSTLLYNATTGNKLKALNNMYQDIAKLKDKIDVYYANHHTIPILEAKYENTSNIQSMNPNDNQVYYVIDLEALDNLNLTYGKEYKAYQSNPSDSFTDLYVINERSHSIYYIKGIQFDKKIYYTVPEENTKVEISNILKLEVIGTYRNVANVKISAVDKTNGIKNLTLMINDHAYKTYEYPSDNKEIKIEIQQIDLGEKESICYFQIEDLEGNIKKSNSITLERKMVDWIADKEGNEIPVPVGFSPITTADQGTKDTGFVIKNDQDGNEFVWVPCTIDGANGTIKYDRYAFTREGWQYNQTKDTATGQIKVAGNAIYFTEAMPSDEEESVREHGGFYIGRYESGVEGYDTDVSINNSSNLKEWTGYSNGKLVIRKDKQVWNYITRNQAKIESEKLYNKTRGDSVNSKLCSSYAWDTALKFIEIRNSAYPTNSIVGNYNDKADTLGKPALTGKTEAVNNIYDMGGNVWDWTTELCKGVR